MSEPSTPPAEDPQLGDAAAMLRVMRPLDANLDPVLGQRRLLADLFRLVGVQIGAVPPPAVADPPAVAAAVGPGVDELTPRAAEVLSHLLAGDGEKQVARRMRLSVHTVHGHVKILYRQFGVSTRAELLALHLRR